MLSFISIKFISFCTLGFDCIGFVGISPRFLTVMCDIKDFIEGVLAPVVAFPSNYGVTTGLTPYDDRTDATISLKFYVSFRF